MTAGTPVVWHKKSGDAIKRDGEVDGQAVDLAERSDSMTVLPQRVERRFWLQWTAASVIAFTFGATAFWGVEKLCEDDLKECLPTLIWTIAFLMVATPALLAFLQWLILRRQLPDAVEWITPTVGGALAGIALIGSALFIVDMRASGIPWWFGPMVAAGFGGALVGGCSGWFCDAGSPMAPGGCW
jgi:hypothetical protein